MRERERERERKEKEEGEDGGMITWIYALYICIYILRGWEWWFKSFE